MSFNGAKGAQELASKTPESEQASKLSLFAAISYYGLLAVIALFSIPRGSIQVSHKSLLILLISVCAGFRILDGITRRSFSIAEPFLLSPLLAVLGLAFVQTVHWPGSGTTVSADPYETRSFILIFGGIIVAAELLFAYTTTTRRLNNLVFLVIAIGAASAVFGLLRHFVFGPSPGTLTGQLRLEQGFAQFVNRNHFALLIEMSFGLLLGILMKADLPAKTKFVGWLLGALFVYSAIVANSRGGLVGLAGSGLFAVAVHMMTRGRPGTKTSRYSPKPMGLLRRIAATAGVLTLVFGLIVFAVAFIGGDVVVTRMERLKGEFETADDARVNRSLIWHSTVEMIKHEPLLGVGFGAYAAAIPQFDTSAGKFRLRQAHNDYLEILSNGGIVGFALFALFAVIVASRTLKNFRSDDPPRRAACFGAAIGIFGVAIHSLVDFGLHVPANALIFVSLVVIATANTRSGAENAVRHAGVKP